LSAVDFGGKLTIDFSQNGFAIGDVWQLFSGASFGGHFTSINATGDYGDLEFAYLGDGEWKASGGLLADGQSLSFYENDNHAYGDIFKAGQLVLVPEPSTVVIAGIGVLIAGLQAWKKRRAIQLQPVV
jgi:hypothetical protein